MDVPPICARLLGWRFLDAIEVAPPGTWNVGPYDTLTVDEIAEAAARRLGLSGVCLTYTPSFRAIIWMRRAACSRSGWVRFRSKPEFGSIIGLSGPNFLE